MTSEPSVRVFFEPKIALHPPDLYAFDHVADGVDAAAAESPSVERYRADGFLVAREACCRRQRSTRPRPSSEPMARADRPDCGMIWYEGALRDHLALDPHRDRPIDGTSPPRPGSSWARRVAACRRSIRNSAPATCASSWASSAARRLDRARPPAGASSRSPERLIGGRPELFQDMALVKPAHGREKPWHQDHAYFNVAIGTPIVGRLDPDGPRDARERLHAPACAAATGRARGRTSSGATGRSAIPTSRPSIGWPCRCRQATCCSSTA